jgi:toxin-antitoxin system PIN domain toxin
MKLVDTNVLLYVVQEHSPQHADSRGWLDAALSRGEPVGFAWLALVGFVRIASNPKMSDSALTRPGALAHIDHWIGAPTSHLLHPGPRHSEFFREALLAARPSANLTNNAHLAAIAREHKATVITFDSDFGQFPGIRWEQPRR